MGVPATWPSGKAEVCKTFIRGFESHRRLSRFFSHRLNWPCYDVVSSSSPPSQFSGRAAINQAAFRETAARALEQLRAERALPGLRKQDLQAGLQSPLRQMRLYVGLQRALARDRSGRHFPKALDISASLRVSKGAPHVGLHRIQAGPKRADLRCVAGDGTDLGANVGFA